MGYQLGTLIKQKILINIRAFFNFYENEENSTLQDLKTLWNIQKKYVPNKVIDYISGIADAVNVSFDKMAVIWVAEGLSYSKCCGMAAWENATENGELISLRSMEFPLKIQDPITGHYIQDYPLIVIAKPENDYGFMYPTFAGYVVECGINEKGITVSNMYSPNSDQTKNGTPMGIRLFKALYSADDAQTAIDIITTNKTFGYNFVVTDSKIPIGYAIETTANHTYVGTWDNPTESTKPFSSIKNVVRRTNIFLNNKTASFQRDNYNPRNIKSIIDFFLGRQPWFYVWHHQQSLTKGIRKIWGRMDLNNTMKMLRNVYKGRYDFMWKMIMRTCPKEVWWQWVAYPENGDVLISFANNKYSANLNSVYKLNFIEILKTKNPTIKKINI